MDEHYGLYAQFSLQIDPQTKTNMGWVKSQLGGIETAVESLSSSLERNNIASQFKADATQTQSAARRMTGAVDQMGDKMKAAAKRIDPLKKEFRALRAEVKLIDFGDITNDRQFKKANNEARKYITTLQHLETQIRGDTTAEREFTAQLKQQQRVMATRMEMQEHQRVAAKAAARVGEFQVVQQAGQLLVNDKLVGQAKDAINVFATFDDKMAGVAAITTATGDSLDALREKAKYLGATTRFTASEAADAMSFLGMAGFKTEAILSGTQSTLDLASAGQLGLAESADIASNVLSGMQLKVEDLGHVTDVMARTATSANTNIQQMGVAMSYAAPNAALFGATLEETSALIGVMSNAGVQADKAGTATRGAFLKLASPVKEGKIALAEMGMTLVDSSGNMRNVIEIFNELNDKLKISPDTLKSIQDAGEDIDSLGEVSQSKQIQALKGIFGTTGISGASAALGQIKELNRLAIATRASSTNTEQLTQYFTELRDIKMKPGQDIFAAIIEQTPNYTEAVRQIDEANLALMQVNLKTLNSLDSSRLTDYFQQVKGISTAPGQSLLAAVVENAPDTQSALNQVSIAMEQLGIQVKGQVGSARLMAQVMENSLPGSFRALESALEAVKVNFIEPLVPLIRGITDTATRFALFLANLPAPIRTTISVGAALTVGMGALAIAIGAAGVTLFGFQQAMAVTNLASSSLAAGLIPLTGFFDTAQKAIIATNPLETFFKRNTQLAWRF
jgi:TP901 family phage tail tape measure protein